MTIANLNPTASRATGGTDASPSSRAAEMVELAIQHCEAKTHYRGRDQIASALRDEIAEVHDYFRHSLACQLAEYLASLDDTVVSVHTHSYGDAEEEGESRSCYVTAPINLILHVRRKTAALSSVVASLDCSLLADYKALVAPHGQKMASLLDIQMVDDEDVEKGIGFGVVLKSTYNRPVRLWARGT